MNRNILRNYLKTPQSRAKIIQEFCSGKDVLDIGCVQHDIENMNIDGWLHNQVVKVAASTLGVDYLKDSVQELADRGYNVMQGDVNNPLLIDRAFDVIVVGNLIEHLSNFSGLMNNLNRLLKPDGVVLISTANPFYCEQYFYSAFKNDIIVNPEHTCWIDPVTLNQLSNRFGLETIEVRWVKERWKLAYGVICHDDRHVLDIFTGKWIFYDKAPIHERYFTGIVKLFLPLIFSSDKWDRLKKNLGNNTDRTLWVMIKGRLFGIYWKIRQLFIPISDINRHELYMSVLKKTGSSGSK
jgi:SAM-dependent methyltransferase